MIKSDALQLLRTSINNPSANFHEDQWEAIDALVNHRKKMLVVERTGWGKSSVYFIATRGLRDAGYGVTVIISPLLALMRNQITSAERLGINAVTVNSTNPEDWDRISSQLLNDEVDVLLISPERLANDRFVETVLAPISERIGLFVVDEAHCISDWGHDFRPDYQRITRMLQQMPPNMPILATTATANNRVVADIERQIGDIETIRGTLIRDSLILQTLELPDQASRLAWIVEHINSIEGTGIIYTSTIRDAEMVAEWLNLNSISAAAYYGSATHEDFENSNDCRQYLEDKLMNNQIKALVATTALGMGYDKPDLGFVIHFQLPSSVVAYYQQVGRAGRGLPSARGILLSGREDADIQSFFINSAFPSEEHVGEVLSALEQSNGLSMRDIEPRVNMRYGQIEKVIKYLSIQSPSPIAKDGSKWFRTPILYQMDHEKIAFLTNQRNEEFRQIEEYLRSQNCLMAFLRQALNDSNIEDCGRCANCDPSNALSGTYAHVNGLKASEFLKHHAMPIEVRKQFPKDAFPQYGFSSRLPNELRAEEGRVLSKWQDAGWGTVVADNKHNNYFSDELVDAVADMIQAWNPVPMPTWVTCVPSLNHTELVPDFAQRLANKLGLPFIESIIKVKQNQPQKMMENRFHQCHNLDGAFEIRDIKPNEPVFLIDDIVDSNWTFTVLSALLRRKGTGAVFPMALTSTANG
ncbi:RecQ family ATP-dependent DNA helicase [Sulfurovum sp. zt1-1]|uniref:DNA 3'-5' helicase n=1 Tax=Sulfurovum zhangzhouensis TaxID=3019067 RepID=A0ABT7QVM7_9BACT|nr:RecQ family ATP-dependent DNA helicase [Sulfurovum zhangzhouensis]MDM5270781.1 RecQ family ATP-dependent DNA helicase [Sulfurovum zhangzhouensis]